MASLSDKYKNSLPFDSSNVTTIVSNYTALNNDVVFVNTASSALTVTLPASPTAGSKIKVLDVAANAQNRNITILGNGRNITGASAYIINTPDSSAEFLFINNTKGWNVLNEYISISKPGSPTAVSAVDVGTGRAYNNGAATVSFTPSTSGDASDSYTVISTPGSYTATGTSSPIVVTGLQSNTSYTFKVFATNAAGNSTESTSSSSITATTVPQAPTINSATDVGTGRAFNNGAATVTFTPGGSGGSSITSYTVTSNTGGYTGTGSSSPITTTGLQSNSSYTFTITATNSNGTSNSSSSSSSITATTVPQAPTINSVTYGFQKVSIAFTANDSGGKVISQYAATSNPGSNVASGASSPISVSGLTGGTNYTFTATATNNNGTSAASTASSSATPFTASGGSITTSGGYRIHQFTGSTNFVLTGNSSSIEYICVAGGGGGGQSIGGTGSSPGGGGGAGGLLQNSWLASPNTYSITVGSGGGSNTNGQNSSISGVTTATGGGGGGWLDGNPDGSVGGSGGGGANRGNSGSSGTAGQGFAGGSGAIGLNSTPGGGGGGSSEPGNTDGAGAGGDGLDISSFLGQSAGTTYLAGGGSGGNGPGGGLGGGGNADAGAGTVNTGGGGAGKNRTDATAGGAGGSGIVIVRYLI